MTKITTKSIDLGYNTGYQNIFTPAPHPANIVIASTAVAAARCIVCVRLFIMMAPAMKWLLHVRISDIAWKIGRSKYDMKMAARNVHSSVRSLSIMTSSSSRIGLGSAKWKSHGPAMYQEVVRTALQEGVNVVEAGPDGGDQALVEQIDRPGVQVLYRIGYRTVQSDANATLPGDKVLEEETKESDGDATPPSVVHNLSVSYVQDCLKSSPLWQHEHATLVPMIHNPEVHGKDWTLDSLVQAFVALEEIVRNEDNPIKNFGVVSNGLGLPSDHPLHLDPSTIWTACKLAAQEIGCKKCSLSVIQLPANVLETQGIQVARQLVSENPNVDVYAMRPLTCYPDRGTGTGLPFEMLDYDLPVSPTERQWTHTMEGPPLAYGAALNAALSHFDGEEIVAKKLDGQDLTVEERETLEGCKLVQSLLHDLDTGIDKVRSFAAHEAELLRTVIPTLHGTFDELDETSAKVLENFFVAHGWAVRHAIARHTRKLLQDGGESPGAATIPKYVVPPDQKLQEFALSHLLREPAISKVIVGCTEPDHVIEDVAVALQIGPVLTETKAR